MTEPSGETSSEAALSDAEVEIANTISGLLKQFVKGGAEITPTTDIMGDLEIDSVAVLDVVMELEDQFDISVPLEVMPSVRTVGDLAREVHKIRVGA